MNDSIDYSSLPVQAAGPTPWQTLRVSVVLTFLFMLIFGTPYYIAETRQSASLLNPLDDITAWCELAAILLFLFMLHHILTSKLKKQRAAMKLFAQQNGWEFEGGKRVADPAVLPTDWKFLGNTAQQIYRVRGSLQDEDFELYAMWGAVRTMFITKYGSTTLGYRTVVRTHAPLKVIMVTQNLRIVREGGWSYILRNGNAITASEVQALLQPLNLAS
jgi:hypothetical protein